MSQPVQIYEGAIDKGLEGVVSCTTSISSIIDATLCFRGYTIEDLAAYSNFEETSFLLWNNKLPSKSEMESFRAEIKKEMSLPSGLVDQLKKLPTNVHPMAWLRTATSMLGLWDAEAQDMSESANRRKSLRLTAKMGLLVALFSRIREGKEFLSPNPEKSIAWNFLYLLKGSEPDPEFVKIFDTCLVLHADHELNCSAFASRVTASSLSDIYSANVSAICALKGPLHGGANEQVMLMLKNEIVSMDKVQAWLADALAGKKKVMGFGHRVYKNGDPRAKILSQMSEVLTQKIGQPQYYQMSKILDDAMQKEKGLLPNVDFYSATVYYSMGIPIDIYTPIFAVSRVAGWCAHILEQYSNNRIYRPRGQWTGTSGLKYQPLEARR